MTMAKHDEILQAVRDLPEEEQLEIARSILLHSESAQTSRLTSLLDELAKINALLREMPASPRARSSAMSLRGIASMEHPPDDATVEQWLDEHRMEKYGA